MSRSELMAESDLVSAVEGALRRRGVLNVLKSRIRAEVFRTLDDRDVSTGLRTQREMPRDLFLVLELVKDFLSMMGLENTLSVLYEEMPISGADCLSVDRAFVGSELGLNTHGSNNKVPLLVLITQYLQANRDEHLKQVQMAFETRQSQRVPSQPVASPQSTTSSHRSGPTPSRSSATSHSPAQSQLSASPSMVKPYSTPPSTHSIQSSSQRSGTSPSIQSTSPSVEVVKAVAPPLTTISPASATAATHSMAQGSNIRYDYGDDADEYPRYTSHHGSDNDYSDERGGDGEDSQHYYGQTAADYENDDLDRPMLDQSDSSPSLRIDGKQSQYQQQQRLHQSRDEEEDNDYNDESFYQSTSRAEPPPRWASNPSLGNPLGLKQSQSAEVGDYSYSFCDP